MAADAGFPTALLGAAMHVPHFHGSLFSRRSNATLALCADAARESQRGERMISVFAPVDAFDNECEMRRTFSPKRRWAIVHSDDWTLSNSRRRSTRAVDEYS